MNRTRRILAGLAAVAAIASMAVAVPATAAATTPGSKLPPCDVTGAYAWQDTCPVVSGGTGGS